MKSTLISFVLSFIVLSSAWATVYTVSNNPLNSAQYDTFLAAHDAASAGDTIYLYGSSTSYGNLDIKKKLAVIGAGANTQNVNLSTIVGNIALHKTDTEDASGSYISGIQFGSGSGYAGLIYSIGSTASQIVQDVVIERCYNFNFITLTYNLTSCIIKNWVFNNCVLTGVGLISTNPNASGGGIYESFIFNNCILTGAGISPAFADSNYYGFKTGATSIFSNCIFYNGSVSTLKSSTVTNCIFITNADNFYFENSSVSNTLFYSSNTAITVSTLFDGTKSNSVSSTLIDVDPEPTVAGSTWTNSDWRLSDTSPGKNYGFDGTDVGIHGGTYPWPMINTFESGNLYKIGPKMPTMTSLNVDAAVPQNGTLKIQVTASKGQ